MAADDRDDIDNKSDATLPATLPARTDADSPGPPSDDVQQVEVQRAAAAREPTSAVDSVLAESTLGRGLLKIGDVFRDYGNWIVIGMLALAALIWIWRLRQDATAQADLASRQGLMQMSESLQSAEQLQLYAPLLTADRLAAEVATLNQNMTESATLTRDADDAVQAHALRLRGDYYWALATLPPARPADPATQPADDYIPVPPAETLLAEAKSAYEQLVKDFPEQQADIRAAMFGLAAIDEEQANFDAAGQRYTDLLALENLPPAQKQQAEARRALLSRLSPQSRLAAPSTRPMTPPVTSSLDDFLNQALGAAMDDDEVPTTQPATQPATAPLPSPVPSTQPAGE